MGVGVEGVSFCIFYRSYVEFSYFIHVICAFAMVSFVCEPPGLLSFARRAFVWYWRFVLNRGAFSCSYLVHYCRGPVGAFQRWFGIEFGTVDGGGLEGE